MCRYSNNVGSTSGIHLHSLIEITLWGYHAHTQALMQNRKYKLFGSHFQYPICILLSKHMFFCVILIWVHNIGHILMGLNRVFSMFYCVCANITQFIIIILIVFRFCKPDYSLVYSLVYGIHVHTHAAVLLRTHFF